MDIEIADNVKQQQFEISADGELATLQYRFYKDDIALMHTHVPEKLKRQRFGNSTGKLRTGMGEET